MRFRKKTKDWTHKSLKDWMGCTGPGGMQSFAQQNQAVMIAAAFGGQIRHKGKVVADFGKKRKHA